MLQNFTASRTLALTMHGSFTVHECVTAGATQDLQSTKPSQGRLGASELGDWRHYVPDAQGQDSGLLDAEQARPAAIRGFGGSSRPEHSLIQHQAATHIPEDAMQNVQRPLPRPWRIPGCTASAFQACFCLHCSRHLEEAAR